MEAATSAPERMPERLLENALTPRLHRPVKVFSIAASGWGQDQQLIALENYFKRYRAELVLLWATPGNDCWENAFPDRSVSSEAGHLKPTYRLAAGNQLNGPFYKRHFYYHHSAILQLVALALMKEKTIEQKILNQWVKQLPAPHTGFDAVNCCCIIF